MVAVVINTFARQIIELNHKGSTLTGAMILWPLIRASGYNRGVNPDQTGDRA